MSGIIHIVKDDKPKPEHTEIWETRAYVSNLGVVVHEAVCVWAKPDENGITTHRPNKYSSAMPMKDHNTPGMAQTGVNPDGSERSRLDQLGRQAALALRPAVGIATSCSPALTEKRGALSPAHSRWLMGFPAAWDSCGAMAMQLCRNLRRNSFKR